MINKTNIKIPKKYENMIREIYHDEDGYWCNTARGFYASGVDLECHTIHEDRQQELLQQIRQIKPCVCRYCRG